MTNHRQAENGV